MNPHPAIERLVYTLIIVLSLIALVLVFISPENIFDTRVVYQGF